MALEPLAIDPALLARKHAEGRWTLEQLDEPPADWPTDRPYYNLAREWIDSHEEEWTRILDEVAPPERVEAKPSPRDYF